MKTLIMILAISLTSICFANKPTTESLLRNGINEDVGNNTVVATLKIKEIDNITNTQPVSDGIVNSVNAKYIIYNENAERPNMTQLLFKGGSFSTSAMFKMKNMSYRNLEGLGSNSEKVESYFYYAILTMLYNNNSELIMNFLKSNDSHLKKNTELVNTEKLGLLRSYKNYLIASKNSEDSTLENPLKPNSEDKRERVSEVYSQSYLRDDQNVKRVKEGTDFHYLVETPNVKMKFDLNHRLKEIFVQTKYGKVSAVLGKFILMGSNFEFPEFIWLTDLTGKKYELRPESIKIFPDNANAQNNRIESYGESILKNKITEEEQIPQFLL